MNVIEIGYGEALQFGVEQGVYVRKGEANIVNELVERIKELENPDFCEMREMLCAMQAGELTVSRGLEILDIWWAGNWDNDQLPPVRQDLIEEDSMPVEIIDRLNARIKELELFISRSFEAHPNLDLDVEHFAALEQKEIGE